MLILYLPYPPSVNAYWLTSGRRKYLSKRGRDFKEQVQEYVIANQVPKLGDIPIQVDIILRPRSKKLMDIDNCGKAICDSLNGYLYEDDQQVWKITIERAEKIKGGGCVVTVKEYSKHDSL